MKLTPTNLLWINFSPDTSLKEYNQDVPGTKSEQNLYKPQDPFKKSVTYS